MGLPPPESRKLFTTGNATPPVQSFLSSARELERDLPNEHLSIYLSSGGTRSGRTRAFGDISKGDLSWESSGFLN